MTVMFLLKIILKHYDLNKFKRTYKISSFLFTDKLFSLTCNTCFFVVQKRIILLLSDHDREAISIDVIRLLRAR